MQTPSELELALLEAGGADAPRERSAQISRLLLEELQRGERELGLARSGYGRPLAVGVVAGERTVAALFRLPSSCARIRMR